MDQSKGFSKDDDKKSKHSAKGDTSVVSKAQSAGEGDDDGEEEQEEELMTQEEILKLGDTFDKISKGNGTIRVEEMLIVAKAFHDKPEFPEQDIFDILNDDEVNYSRKINKDQYFQILEELRKRENDANEEDTIDAYVALGGLQNKDGYVDATKLINIIKNDFEMTIDIEKLIQDIDEDGSGKIEYGEFNTLLNSNS